MVNEQIRVAKQASAEELAQAMEKIEEERIAQGASELLVNLLGQARMADEKVRALFTANTIFVAALVIGSTTSFAQLSTAGLTLLGILELGLRVALLVALAISLASSILGLLPRLELDEPDRSLFFFGHIASMPKKRFIDDFMNLSFGDWARDLLSQVHVNSQIVQLKYKWIRRSATFLLLAVGLWLAALAVHYLS